MRVSVACATVVRLQFQQRHGSAAERRVELEVPGAPVHGVPETAERTLCGEPLAGLHTFVEKSYGDVRPDNRCPDCHNAFLYGDSTASWRGRGRAADD